MGFMTQAVRRGIPRPRPMRVHAPRPAPRFHPEEREARRAVLALLRAAECRFAFEGGKMRSTRALGCGAAVRKIGAPVPGRNWASARGGGWPGVANGAEPRNSCGWSSRDRPMLDAEEQNASVRRDRTPPAPRLYRPRSASRLSVAGRNRHCRVCR